MYTDDDDDDDEYIMHGQLSNPIHEDEVVQRKDAEQQFVKDENERRRFHGAFTGGFSAGFYNTVGSLEGWTPSTFQSSRDSKSTLKSQNAYDFMDEEDKKDLGIDASSLKIIAKYSHSSRKRQLPIVNTGPIPSKSQSFNPTNVSFTNENTRQREMKKPEPHPSVAELIKKQVPSLLSGILSNGFTRAALPDDFTNALIPVVRTTDPTLERLKNHSSKQKYGFWTRKTEPQVPEKLHCKRFKIPVPKQSMVNYTEDGKKHGQYSLFNSLEFSTNEHISTRKTEIPNNLPLAINNVKSVNDKSLSLKKSVTEKVTDVGKCRKPTGDLFKDFLCDDSDDEILTVQNSSKSEEVSKNSNENKLHSANISIKKENQRSTRNSLFSPKPIFANPNISDLFDTPEDGETENRFNFSMAINNVKSVNDKSLNLKKSVTEKVTDVGKCRKPTGDLFKDFLCDDSDDEILTVQNSSKSEEVSKNSNENKLHSANISIKKENQRSTRNSLFSPKPIFANPNISDLFDTPEDGETENRFNFSMATNNVKSVNDKSLNLKESVTEKGTDVGKCRKPTGDLFKDFLCDDSDDEILTVQNSSKSEEVSKNSNENKLHSANISIKKENQRSTRNSLFSPKPIFANPNISDLFDTPEDGETENRFNFSMAINNVKSVNDKSLNLKESVTEKGTDVGKCRKPTGDLFKDFLCDDSDDEILTVQNSSKSEEVSKNSNENKLHSANISIKKENQRSTRNSLFSPKPIFANPNISDLFDTPEDGETENRFNFSMAINNVKSVNDKSLNLKKSVTEKVTDVGKCRKPTGDLFKDFLCDDSDDEILTVQNSSKSEEVSKNSNENKLHSANISIKKENQRSTRNSLFSPKPIFANPNISDLFDTPEDGETENRFNFSMATNNVKSVNDKSLNLKESVTEKGTDVGKCRKPTGDLFKDFLCDDSDDEILTVQNSSKSEEVSKNSNENKLHSANISIKKENQRSTRNSLFSPKPIFANPNISDLFDTPEDGETENRFNFSMAINNVKSVNDKSLNLKESVTEKGTDVGKCRKPTGDLFKDFLCDDSDDEILTVQNSSKSEEVSKNSNENKLHSANISIKKENQRSTRNSLFSPKPIFANPNISDLFDTPEDGETENRFNFSMAINNVKSVNDKSLNLKKSVTEKGTDVGKCRKPTGDLFKDFLCDDSDDEILTVQNSSKSEEVSKNSNENKLHSANISIKKENQRSTRNSLFSPKPIFANPNISDLFDTPEDGETENRFNFSMAINNVKSVNDKSLNLKESVTEKVTDVGKCRKPTGDLFKDFLCDDSDDEILTVQNSSKSEEVSKNSNENKLHSANISIKKENQRSTRNSLFSPKPIFANPNISD